MHSPPFGICIVMTCMCIVINHFGKCICIGMTTPLFTSRTRLRWRSWLASSHSSCRMHITSTLRGCTNGRLRQYEALGMHAGLQRHTQKAEPVVSLHHSVFETELMKWLAWAPDAAWRCGLHLRDDNSIILCHPPLVYHLSVPHCFFNYVLKKYNCTALNHSALDE